MDTDDAALMYQGWGDELLLKQQEKKLEIEAMAIIVRQGTAYICDTVYRTFGGKGKGLFKSIIENWTIGEGKKEKSNGLITKLDELTKQWREKDLVDKHKKLGLNKGLKRKTDGKR